MTVVVTSLHACQPVRLRVSTNVTVDAVRGKQRLDARSNPLQLKAVNGCTDEVVGPARECSDNDRLLATSRGNSEIAFSRELRYRLASDVRHG